MLHRAWGIGSSINKLLRYAVTYGHLATKVAVITLRCHYACGVIVIVPLKQLNDGL